MFGRLHPARLCEAKFTTKHLKDNDDEQRLVIVTLAYDFTTDVAEALGGAAPALQEMLAKGIGTEGLKVARAGVVLDVKDVAMKIVAGDKEKIAIEHTLALKAKADQPTASSNTPTLEVTATFSEDAEETALFLIQHRGQMCKVRLDKRQLDLPNTDKDGEAVEGEEKTED